MLGPEMRAGKYSMEPSQPSTTQPRDVSLRRRFLSLPTLLSFAVAAVLLALLFTRFDLDWQTTWGTIRSINIWMYLAAMAVYFASFWFRGLRWQLLARNTGAVGDDAGDNESHVPSALKSSQFILIGWFVNSVMWLRLGDAYRAYLFAQESKGSFSWSLGTILAERIADIATMLVVLVAGIALFTITNEGKTANLLLSAVLVIGGLCLALLLAMRYYGQRLARLLPRRLETAYNRFQQGTLGSFKRLPLVFLLGLMAWSLEIGRLYLVVSALGLDAPVALITIVALGHALLTTVPTPGGVGVVEPGIIGLLLISLERSDAVSVTLVDRSITYLSVILVGGIIFLIMQVASKRPNGRLETAISAIKPGS